MPKRKECLELLKQRRKMFLFLNNKRKNANRNWRSSKKQKIWEMKTGMMLKKWIKWLCMLKLLRLEINSSRRRSRFIINMWKKKNKRISWLKLIDYKLLKMPRKEKESTKLNKKSTMKWLFNKLKKENYKESELKKKLKKKVN